MTYRGAVLAAALVAGACSTGSAGGAASGSTVAEVQAIADGPGARTGPTIEASQPTVAAGVDVIEATCADGADELCNGLDDDCDGQIDEGCGYSSGNVQITLHWEGGADIDLYVTDPAGETINYAHPRAASGGHLDHDARGRCSPEGPTDSVENVYWSMERPPTGTYIVDLHYWGECQSGAGPTTSTVSISVGGQIIGSYRYTLSPNERVTLASFSL